MLRDGFFETERIDLAVHSGLQRSAATLAHAMRPTFPGEFIDSEDMKSSPMRNYGIAAYDGESSSDSGGEYDEEAEAEDGSGTEPRGPAPPSTLTAPLRQKSMKRGASRRTSTGASVSNSVHMARMGRVPFSILECQYLNEETPLEYLAGGLGFRKRIKRFEAWLARRRGISSVLICGHSAFFKAMLKQKRKMNNCDLIEVEFTITEKSTASPRRKKRSGGAISGTDEGSAKHRGNVKLVTSWGEPTLIYRVCHRKQIRDDSRVCK